MTTGRTKAVAIAVAIASALAFGGCSSKTKAAIADWDGFKSIANSVQGTYTRRVVDQVQKALGKSKATNA